MKKPAVFLDRDGVLVKEKGYIRALSEMEIFGYAKECIEQIHTAGYWAIVITNQSAVGRGILKKEELEKMNRRLKNETEVDDIYYCPHWEKENAKCLCRKPGTGLIQKAMERFSIDLRHSYFVGDRASDIETGINAGIETVLLESGYGTMRLEKPVDPDFIFEDLKEFSEELISCQKLCRKKEIYR